MRRRAGPREIPITARALARVRHEGLRGLAAEALARGEPVRLVVGAGADPGPVETLVLGPSRAVQSAGEGVVWGSWSGSRLRTDRGLHLLDADGHCFCRECETAAGLAGDDDE
jgi:hypothetical protein